MYTVYIFIHICCSCINYTIPSCTDVLPGQSLWSLLSLRLLSVSKCNCCGGLCHQVHPLHCGSHCVHSIWSADEVAANAHIYTEHYNGCWYNGLQWVVCTHVQARIIIEIMFSLPILHRCCIKCMYCKKQRQNFSGVWLIAVMLINPAIHTSFSILQCPGVEKEDGRWMNVRMYDDY